MNKNKKGDNMDFKNIFNRGKEYAVKVKDNINKTIEDANNKKALIEEKINNAVFLSSSSFQPIKIEVLDNNQQTFYDYLIQECKLNGNENVNSLISLIVLNNEVLLTNTTLTDKKQLENYNVFFTENNMYILKDSNYLLFPYSDIKKIQLLDRGVVSATLEFNNFVICFPTSVVDTILMLISNEEKRKEWKTNIQNKYLDFKNQRDDDNSVIGMEKRIIANGLQMNKTTNWIRNNFEIISNRIQENEQILYPFVGMLNYRTNTDPGVANAFALTNHRLVYANQGLMGDNFFAIPRNQITGITLNNTALDGVITIHTSVKSITIGVAAEKSLALFNYLKSQFENNETAKNDSTSIADEIAKLKDLLDAGAITQEEFEQGKAKLLG